MRRNAKDFLEQRLRQTCAWCGKIIGEDEPVYALGVSCRPGVDVTELRGTFIPFPLLSGKTIPAMVSTEDSEAKRDGWDFIFMACSRECAQELRLDLEIEKEWFAASAMLD